MLKTIFFASALLGLAWANCDSYEKDLYEELGCRSEGVDGSGCPTSYDCSHLWARASDKCYHNRQPYDANARLVKPSTCIAECTCLQTPNAVNTSTDTSQFNCAKIECPELFRGPPKPGCHRVYEHGTCCSTKEVCPSPEERNALHQCNVDSKMYYKGEKFYPKGDRCKVCICSENYAGKNVEPFCERIKCDLDLHYSSYEIAQGCIPTYYGDDGCCPIYWRCPATSDRVIPAEPRAETKTGAKRCKFGNLTMNVGDTLSQAGGPSVCKCRLPPMPVCVLPENPGPEA